MTLFFQETLFENSAMIVISFMVAFTTYYLINSSREYFLSFLYLPASKSPTNAKLLGGLGFTTGITAAVVYLAATHTQKSLVTKSDLDFVLFALIPISLLTVSGYIDDRYEIRARYKLAFQLLAISTFASYTTFHVALNQPMIVFGSSVALGILLINGTNLLDGLDTMTVKLGIVVSLTFAYLGMKSESSAVILISACTIAVLGSFYLFNREPARIYMGEIGGSVVGFLFYTQATLCYKNLIKFQNGYKSFSWIIVACSLPLCELGISFLRRVIMKKSPFRGDKLHLHYILKSKYKLTASSTSTFMAVLYGSIFSLGYAIAKYSLPQFGALVSVALIVSFYVSTCYKEWAATVSETFSKNLYLYFEEKTVHVLNSETLNNVSITVMKSGAKNRRSKKAA